MIAKKAGIHWVRAHLDRKAGPERIGIGSAARRGDLLVRQEHVINRHRKWYFEEVIACRTGEAIHHCAEPLIDHKGHGSDKKKWRE